MSLFLNNYDFFLKDSLLSLTTGFTGISYAKRHWDLSAGGTTLHRWGHRTIALFEFIPLIGGLAAFLERITYVAKNALFGKSATQFPILDINDSVDKFATRFPIEAIKGLFDKSATQLPSVAQNVSVGESATANQASVGESVIQSMWKNSQKAICEHNKKGKGYLSISKQLSTKVESFMVHKACPH